MFDRQFFGVAPDRCGNCSYRTCERRIGFLNGTAVWSCCRKRNGCPSRWLSRLEKLRELCRKWIDLP